MRRKARMEKKRRREGKRKGGRDGRSEGHITKIQKKHTMTYCVLVAELNNVLVFECCHAVIGL